MKLKQNYQLLLIFALMITGCNSSEKLFSIKNPIETTPAEIEVLNSDPSSEWEYQPSTSTLNEECAKQSHEITYFTSTEVEPAEILETGNNLIIYMCPEVLSDTLPTPKWLSQSQLARESKIAGIWGLAIFFFLPIVSIIFGIIALDKGRRAQRIIAKSPESYINARDAKAGIVMGAIIIGLFILTAITITIYILAASGIINLPEW